MIDSRLLAVDIEIDGNVYIYTDLAITASGIKYASPTQGECNITIANLRSDIVDQILTESSPFNSNPNPKRIKVRAGRASTGYSVVYSGDIFRSELSQPPDQVLTIRALTSDFNKRSIISSSGTDKEALSEISKRVASSLGVGLEFLAKDKQIANFSFKGPALRQVDSLAAIGSVAAFIDNDTLFIKDYNQPISGSIRTIDSDQIIGIPTITESGIRVSFLYDNNVSLGSQIKVNSSIYSRANGLWNIYKLYFNLSNRDTPFNMTAEAMPVDR